MLELKNISVHFGGIKALNNVSFKVEKESLFSIIGPNGAGKTSLLNVISGRYKPKNGDLLLNGKNITNEVLKIQLYIPAVPDLIINGTTPRVFNTKISNKYIFSNDILL